jgi:hypothetical protein
MKKLMVAAVFALVACGGSGSKSPTKPTLLEPSFVTVSQALEVPATCPTGRCSYSFQAKNQGPGCGHTVKGTITLLASGRTLATDNWALESSRIVHVNEIFDVSACCLVDSAVRESQTIRVTYDAKAVSCS